MKNLRKILPIIFCFIIIACKKDPCDSVKCINDGHCSDGKCVCTEKYTGLDCSKQVTPLKITIRQITVSSFPKTAPNGLGWDGDPAAGPDIFPVLFLGKSVVYVSDIYYKKADPFVTSYDYSVNPAAELLEPNSEYTMALFDYDGGTNADYIGEVKFTPYSSTNAFPDPIKISDSNSKLEFKIYVSYIFK